MTATTVAKIRLASTGILAVSPAMSRAVLLAVITIAFVAGFHATSAPASAAFIAHDDAALTRLMRFMAVVKAGLALAACAAVLWRLGTAITLARFAAYAVSGGAMVAGPGLIWGMAHVGLGALLLHGGLIATVLLLWRDPAVGSRLAALVAARRARHQPAAKERPPILY
jgi:hypothetical protein